MSNQTQKLSKKQALDLVYHKFAAALSAYEKELAPKKLKAKLKKASRLFASDIAKLGTKTKSKMKKKADKPTTAKHPASAVAETVS